jgi:hypothetical protein
MCAQPFPTVPATENFQSTSATAAPKFTPGCPESAPSCRRPLPHHAAAARTPPSLPDPHVPLLPDVMRLDWDLRRSGHPIHFGARLQGLHPPSMLSANHPPLAPSTDALTHPATLALPVHASSTTRLRHHLSGFSTSKWVLSLSLSLLMLLLLGSACMLGFLEMQCQWLDATMDAYDLF